VDLRKAPVRFYGSWSGIGISRSLVHEFVNSHGSGAIKFRPCDSDQLSARLANHRCDVALVLDSSAPSIKKDLDERFDAFPLGRFVVYVIVNAKCPVRKVTFGELRNIYRGRITSWQDVGNSKSASRIELYSPLSAKTESYLFRQKVMRGARFGGQLTDRSIRPARQKMTADEVIGSVVKNRNAIGFFMLGYENKLDKRVRVLGIAKDKRSKPVFPSAATIRDGTYPLTDTMTLHLHPDAPTAALEFCEFATGSDATKIVKPFRLFPDYQWQQYLGKLRLAEMKRGRGTPIAASGAACGAALMRDLAVEFVKAKATVQLRYRGASQLSAVQEFLRRGELLLLDEPLPDGITANLGRQWSAVNPREVPLGRIGVGIVVHPTNRVELLSIAQLKAIYLYKLQQWSAVDGSQEPIRLYGLTNTSLIERLFRERLGMERPRRGRLCRLKQGLG
jgi:phosphate transport system substrate-binding protein